MLLKMDSVEVSHKTLFIFGVGSVLQGVERVAELAVGVYHVTQMRAREADTMESRSVVSRMQLRMKILRSDMNLLTRIM